MALSQERFNGRGPMLHIHPDASGSHGYSAESYPSPEQLRAMTHLERPPNYDSDLSGIRDLSANDIEQHYDAIVDKTISFLKSISSDGTNANFQNMTETFVGKNNETKSLSTSTEPQIKLTTEETLVANTSALITSTEPHVKITTEEMPIPNTSPLIAITEEIEVNTSNTNTSDFIGLTKATTTTNTSSLTGFTIEKEPTTQEGQPVDYISIFTWLRQFLSGFDLSLSVSQQILGGFSLSLTTVATSLDLLTGGLLTALVSGGLMVYNIVQLGLGLWYGQPLGRQVNIAGALDALWGGKWEWRGGSG